MVVGGSLLFSGSRECCALQRFPQRCAVRRNRARALIASCCHSDFGSRLSPTLARASPTRARRGAAHTAPLRGDGPAPAPPSAPSRCWAPRPRPCPARLCCAGSPALPGSALLCRGSPAPSPPGIWGSAPAARGARCRRVPGPGDALGFWPPSHPPPCPVSSVVPAV